MSECVGCIERDDRLIMARAEIEYLNFKLQEQLDLNKILENRIKIQVAIVHDFQV